MRQSEPRGYTDDRESIWSVPRGTRTAFSLLFAVQFFCALCLYWGVIQESTAWFDRFRALVSSMGPAAIVCASSSMLLAEIYWILRKGVLMVLGEWIYDTIKRRRQRRLRRQNPTKGQQFHVPEPHDDEEDALDKDQKEEGEERPE